MVIYKWLLTNKISLNKTKTELIIFRKPNSNICHDMTIKLNGHRIYPSATIKYLGFQLDETLSGAAHCSELAKKLIRANAMLTKVQHYVSEEKLISINFAFFSSHMTYGCQVWGQNHSSKKFQIIEKLQDRAMKIMSFSRYDSAPDPIYKKFNILKLKDHITRLNCLLIHDYSRNLLPKSFNNFFIPCSDLYSSDTRHAAGSLFVPSVNSTKYGLKSIKLSSIFQWNYLTESLEKNMFTLSRYAIKQFLSSHFINSYSS